MNRNHSIKALLFDWDGTLVDSAHLGLAAFEKTFSESESYLHMMFIKRSIHQTGTRHTKLWDYLKNFGKLLMTYGFDITANSRRR